MLENAARAFARHAFKPVATSPPRRREAPRRCFGDLRDDTWRPMAGREDVDPDPRAALHSLSAEWGFHIDPGQAALLLEFADLLIRWNQSINLTGARSVGAVVAEHYPDAFALAKRLDGPARLIDVGSG